MRLTSSKYLKKKSKSSKRKANRWNEFKCFCFRNIMFTIMQTSDNIVRYQYIYDCQYPSANHIIVEPWLRMKLPFRFHKTRFLVVNAIFAVAATFIEWAGTSTSMYVYADDFHRILNVPLIIIAYWVFIGHTSWVVYRKFGWIAGLLTGIIIDLPFEFLAFHLGWWTWIPSWSPAIFFNAPVANFIVYLSVSLGSILTWKYIMNIKL